MHRSACAGVARFSSSRRRGVVDLLCVFLLGSCGPPPREAPDASIDTNTGDGSRPSCKVLPDTGDASPVCNGKARPTAFEAELQWSWTNPTEPSSNTTPLVANLTDDNGDGAIDLCDIPDIVVVGQPRCGYNETGHIYVLDGATGALHRRFSEAVASVTPAIGDLDGDGVPEVIAVDPQGAILAFEADGTVRWRNGQYPGRSPISLQGGSIALADLDHDGGVEIIVGSSVFDRTGAWRWTAPTPHDVWPSTIAADLDGDGLMEVVLGKTAYHHDGSPYYTTDLWAGFPQIANFDDDPEPEIVLASWYGVSLLQHDGQISYSSRQPTGDLGSNTWYRPATIRDLDGDHIPEFLMSSKNHYSALHHDAAVLWSSAAGIDITGSAGGTAFDFLGDGTFEVVYADETTLHVFDASGATRFETIHETGTIEENPVVADIDNDGAAEIVVVASSVYGAPQVPMVRVFRDPDDRWAPARRIWNQHSYHVTNIREDATIPQFEIPSWQAANTYRINSSPSCDGVILR